METDKLISELAQKADPVRTPRPVWFLLLIWIGAVSLVLGLGMGFHGMRDDMMLQGRQPLFWIESLLLFLAGLVAVGTVLRLAIPGRKVSWQLIYLPALIFVILFGLSWGSHRGMHGGMHENLADLCTRESWGCLGTFLLFAAPLFLLLLVMLRRGASLSLGLSGALSFFAVAAFSSLGMQMTCCHDLPVHHLVYHILPLAVVAVIGVVAGRIIFKWNY